MKIDGRNISLHTVNINDAEFIFNMRKDNFKTRFLSKINGTVEDQKQWIKTYKQKEIKKEEFYFIIKSKNNENLGLVRLYDFKKDSFCWGSWLIKDSAPKLTAIESALQVYEFAFGILGFTQSHFDVRKNNKKVISFHQRFGAKIVNEDELNYFFIYKKDNYEKIRKKYKRFL